MKDTTDLLNAAIRLNTGAWFETYGKIWPKDRNQGLITPRQNYLQKKTQDVILKFEELELPCRIIGLKPRQKGSTTYFSACGYTKMRRQPTSACVIGGQYSQTDELWKMLQTYAANDRFEWGNKGEINAKAGTFSNGSKLKAETAGDALAGISGTYQFLQATEVARWSKYGVANAGEVLSNILKCVPLLPGTMVILESTAEGNNGEYYNRYITAIKMEDFLSGRVVPNPGQYVAVFAPWFEFSDSAIRLNDDQKKHIENTLDEDEEFSGERELIERYSVVGEDGVTRLGTAVEDFDVWEQLAWRRGAIHEECKRDKAIFDRDYPHSAEDAFMKSGNTRFSNIGLSVLRKNTAKVVPHPGIIEEVAHGRVAFRPTGPGESTVTVFEKPTMGSRYILSVDPMTGITQTGGDDPDWHSAFVIRAGLYDAKGKWVKPCTAARVIPCRWEIDMLEKWVWRLARMYGSTTGCKIVIEMNQDRGITELLKLRGADLYQREMFNQREHTMAKALGYQTNVKTREVLVERLATAIRDHDVTGSGIDIWCPHAITQAENFIRKENGRSEAAEGHKDDDMFAIGLGLTVIDHATVYMPPRSMLGWFQPPEFGGSQNQPKASQYS